ncbi:MAG: flagellar export chaperone FlgN [Lachnospiraceae bacterium]|nr:flagellar export chaperone FlgN [Lachnospiraceae bacterium]
MDQSGAQILLQSLEKKNQLLDQMIRQNGVQEEILKQEELDMDAFDEAIDKQSSFVEQLDKLDRGFEAVYDRFREELIENKERYRDEIARMKQQIQQITDKIVTLNAGNMRNKMLAENQFKKRRQEIGTGASKSRVARNYYNSMNNLNYVSPQFYDNKK